MQADLEVFKACADKTRMRVLFLLAQRELCVCELVEVLGMPQGKVSRHLAVLKRAGLVDSRREGVWMHYALRPPQGRLPQLVAAYLAGTGVEEPVVVQDHERLRRLGKLVCAPPAARRRRRAR